MKKGNKIDQLIRKVLKPLLTDKMIKEFTWTGQRTPNQQNEMRNKRFINIIAGMKF